MAKFRIMPHGRRQEWVAEEKGYFTGAGLEYEFVYDYSTGTAGNGAAGSAEPSGVRMAWL
jgi:hypothetical protein